MENKRKLSFRRASFVKVLDDNFIEKLEMPPSFVNIFEGDIPPWLILEISGSRKCWRVDVEDDENGRVYLSYGFNCFIKAHSLEAGNFLLFEYEKPSILQVKIYEKDGFERANESTLELEYEIIASKSPKQTPKIHEGKPSESPRQIIHVGGNAECPRQPPIVDDVSETPRQSQIIRYGECEIQRNGINNTKRKKCMMTATRFSLSWRKARHFLYYMTIPKPMLVDKTYSNNETVLLKDTEGNSWQMELRVRKDGRVDEVRKW